MANNKKMTLVENYTAIQKMLNGETVEGYTVENAVAFLNGRIEQTTKKNTSASGEKKLTKTQIENETTKETIVAVLGTLNHKVTISELNKAEGLAHLSPNKLTALVTQLVKANRVTRTEEKGRAYFALSVATN